MKNKNKTVWSKRLKSINSKSFQRIGSSIKVDKRLYKQDIFASIVHAQMLAKQKIIPSQEGKKIIIGLKKIEKQIKNGKFIFQEKFEDIHLNIEKKLFETIGQSAGYLHTARSRNDQVVTDFKLWVKDSTKDILKDISKIMKALITKADKNIETVMPGFTHLKNAQAVSFAHYLMAYVEMFTRDKKRFSYNLENLSECPLGVAALSGTSFNIDRNFTSKKLGFKKPTNNSIDTVADRDFVLDFLYSASVCSMHISRIAEELIIWNSDGFNLITLSDKVVTGSSIMPQKKNPDLLEYLRGKTGTVYGNLFSMLTILKGLPISYFKDLQDDKEILFKSDEILNNCIAILAEVLKNLKPNKKKMLALTNSGYITATDLADYLVKNHSMPFRKAYQTTTAIVNIAEKKRKKLNELSIEELKKIEPKLTTEVLKIFDVKNSINSKKSYGGTSFDNIKKMIMKYKKI